jgi:hypothetical protein
MRRLQSELLASEHRNNRSRTHHDAHHDAHHEAHHEALTVATHNEETSTHV